MTQSAESASPARSILRRRSSSGSPQGRPGAVAVRKGSQDRRSGVHFPPPPNLTDMLDKYYTEGKKNIDELEGFITHMKNQRGDALINWLQILQENITLLRPDLERFVNEILKISWAVQPRPVVAAFKHFLVNLASAQCFYVRAIMCMLVKHFMGAKVCKTQEEIEAEKEAFDNVHETIQSMLKVDPIRARQHLLKYSKECLPFMLTQETRSHTNFILNLARELTYLEQPDDRKVIWQIIIDRLVQLDAYLPKLTDYEEDSDDEDDTTVFAMDKPDQGDAKPKLGDDQIARLNLDQAMNGMFMFVDNQFSHASLRSSLFRELLTVFESHILPTYATGHVQFLLFRLLSLDQNGSYTTRFLDGLWSKFCDPSTPGILRQAAVAYIASLIARGKFCDLSVSKICLQKMVEWVHAYLAARDGVKGRQSDYMFVDIKAHGPFYAACQSALYIFAFRHQEFVANEKMLAFLRSLNLQTIVTSHLNPLRVCLPPVVKNFASIARHYQLVYCDTIIERNNRISLPVVGNLSALGSSGVGGKPLLLDAFFPFDPYTLKDSGKFVEESYRVFSGSALDDEEEDSSSDDESDVEEMEEDDVLGDLSLPSENVRGAGSLLNEFMYGTSPGFKC